MLSFSWGHENDTETKAVLDWIDKIDWIDLIDKIDLIDWIDLID